MSDNKHVYLIKVLVQLDFLNILNKFFNFIFLILFALIKKADAILFNLELKALNLLNFIRISKNFLNSIDILINEFKLLQLFMIKF